MVVPPLVKDPSSEYRVSGCTPLKARSPDRHRRRPDCRSDPCPGPAPGRWWYEAVPFTRIRRMAANAWKC